MSSDPQAVRREQFRQARHLSGGLGTMALAVLGVRLARVPIPTERLRRAIYHRVFSRRYPPGLNELEAEKPLGAYPSLQALFTRGLKPECRPIPVGTPQVLAPCDGVVQDAGRVENGQILVVKGIRYTVASLLGGRDAGPFEGGHFLVIFLSPIHCHRVFSPQDGHLTEALHVPGHRLPVHPPCQRPEFPVYTLNERMVLHFATPLGPCAVVMVAGWGVGNVSLPGDPAFRPRGRAAAARIWSPPAPVRRGEWVATFELGSTVVLLTPPAAGARCLVSPNEDLKYGQPVLTYPG
jgi:phosphatidylserine decarboxylase